MVTKLFIKRYKRFLISKYNDNFFLFSINCNQQFFYEGSRGLVLREYTSIVIQDVAGLILATLTDGEWQTVRGERFKFTTTQMRLLILLKGQPDYQDLEYYNIVITISLSGGCMCCP